MTDPDPALDISNDVLYGIAQLALDQVDGVSATTPPLRVGEFLTGRRAKGIRVDRDGDRVRVALTVAVAYGLRIPAVAAQVQRAIREAVASMTGLEVASVTVTVDSIEPPEELRRG